jgi:hypothetical protein
MKFFYWILLLFFSYNASIMAEEADTTLTARQETYYQAYKKGIRESGENRKTAVNFLMNGLNDVNAGLKGQILGYLQSFSVSDFDAESRSFLAGKLNKPNQSHYDDLVLLAGFVGVGRDELNSYLVSYVLSDLIYTRRKAALDYCVALLYSDDELCRSPNPDYDGSIVCAYRIIELLAPVIVDFPIQVNPSIGLETDDYPKTLQSIRDWFKQNPDYRIIE